MIKVVIYFIVVLGSCFAQSTFRNPVLDGSENEPSVIKYRDFYYMTYNSGKNITLLKSPILSNWRDAERSEIYNPESSNITVHSPKIHVIQNDLYIYFAKINSGTRRMHVIKCLDPTNPMGQWSNSTSVLPETEGIREIHGTVMEYPNGDLFFIWSGNVSDINSLYIARMVNPTTAVEPKARLRVPAMDWERHEGARDESPSILQYQGRTFLIFSASDRTSPEYCLGIMGIDGLKDPMLPYHWWNDVNQCIFAKSDVGNVWAPGHSTFVKSPDETETWMLYDAWNGPNENNANRTIRLQKIEWFLNSPVFPLPINIDKELTVPSGEEM